MRALLVPVVLLLAGCVDVLGASPEPEGADPWRSIRVEGCTMAIASLPVPVEAAQARLPEGFTPEPYRGAPAGMATAATWAWTCQRSDEGDWWSDLVVALRAIPPAELASEEAFWHAVIVSAVNGRADVVERYAAWNVTFAQAPVRFSTGATGPALTASASVTLPEGPFAFEFRGGPNATAPEGVVRAFSATEGVVTGGFDYVWTPYTAVTGSVEVTAGTGLWGVSTPRLAGTGILELGEDYDFELRPFRLPP